MSCKEETGACSRVAASAGFFHKQSSRTDSGSFKVNPLNNFMCGVLKIASE